MPGKLGRRNICTVSCPIRPPDPQRQMPQFRSPRCEFRIDTSQFHREGLDRETGCGNGPILPLARGRQYPEHSSVAHPKVGPLRYVYQLGHTLPGRTTFHEETPKLPSLQHIPHHEYDDFRKTVIRCSVLSGTEAMGGERHTHRAQIETIPTAQRDPRRADVPTSIAPILSHASMRDAPNKIELLRAPRLDAPPSTAYRGYDVQPEMASSGMPAPEIHERAPRQPRLQPTVPSFAAYKSHHAPAAEMHASEGPSNVVRRRVIGQNLRTDSRTHPGCQPSIGVARTRFA